MACFRSKWIDSTRLRMNNDASASNIDVSSVIHSIGILA